MAANKEYITYNDFVQRLEKGAIKPICLFQGDETFLIEECLERVKHALISPEAADFNYNKYSGKEIPVGDVLDQMQTMPFLSKWRLIVLQHVHELPAAAQKQLLPYLENPNQTTCLIVTAPKLDSRTKFAQALKKRGEVVQFWKLFDRDIPRWVCSRAQHYGYSMSVQTAAYLSEFVGNDLRQLDNELKKVVAYSSRKEISPDVVQHVVGDVRERNIFELMDAISSGQVTNALRILEQLLIEGEPPLRILAMIIRQFRLLWKTKAILADKKSLSARQLAGQIGVPFRSAEALQRQVRRFSQRKLKKGLKRTYDVDRALKSSTNSPEILLEDLLIDLCT